MSNTKKQPQEAQVGDRVWAKQGETMVAGHITETKIFFGDDRGSMVRIFGSAYGLDEFKDAWGFLADGETVIGGVLIRPSTIRARGWLVGGYSFTTSTIKELGLHCKCCQEYALFDSHIAEIQAHVRKHSAPVTVPKKRTANDAEEGDDIYVMFKDGPVRRRVKSVKKCVSVRTICGYTYSFEAYGAKWGFWEDRPDTTKALPSDQPAPDEGKPLPPQLGNVALLIKAKGSDWVKANYPDLWDAYKAAGLEKVRSAAEKLAKPGPLAGKMPNLH